MQARRTIPELLTRYRFEPDTRDVFVEGHLDQAVLRRFLRSRGQDTTGVFRIETVEVPNDLLLPAERGSNRGRLVALGRELATQSSGSDPPVRCIVDRDFDDLLGSPTVDGQELVLSTDMASMEMYLLEPDLIRQLVADYFRLTGIDVERLIADINEALASASLMFAANQSLDLGCSHIPLERCATYSRPDGLGFDAGTYKERYLNKGGSMASESVFDAEVARLRSAAPADPRSWIRGRDFVSLLGFALRKHGAPKELCVARAITGALTLAAGTEFLEEFELFRALDAWAA